VILALIVRAITCQEKILVCAETNFAVRLVAGAFNTYIKKIKRSTEGSFLIQRNAIETLGGHQQMEDDDAGDMELDIQLPDRTRQILAMNLKSSDIDELSIASLILHKLTFLKDPDYRNTYKEPEYLLLKDLEWKRISLIETNVGFADEDTGPSTERSQFGRPTVVLGNQEDEEDNVKKAQKMFDKAWFEVAKYYVNNTAKVIFVTAGTCTTRSLKGFSLSTIIIDEASQMTEVASVSVIATFFHSVKKVILAGDLQQNHPFVGSSQQNEFSKTTAISLMQRMLFIGVPSTFLSRQYRMHPHISKLVSEQFYEGRLTDDTTVVDRKDKDSIFRAALGSLFPASTPHHTLFLNVLDGKLFTARKGGSKANPVYAAAVQRVVNRLIAKGARGDSIGILTFYQAQRHLHDLFSPPSVQVMTVDASQGREFDFVVLDLVTPGGNRYGLGFVAEPTRINVGLSRAKHGLVFVGSKVMADLKHQNKGPKIWAEIIRSHAANGALQTVSADGRRFEEKLSLKQYFCK
jgi:hypothetical protein